MWNPRGKLTQYCSALHFKFFNIFFYVTARLGGTLKHVISVFFAFFSYFLIYFFSNGSSSDSITIVDRRYFYRRSISKYASIVKNKLLLKIGRKISSGEHCIGGFRRDSLHVFAFKLKTISH